MEEKQSRVINVRLNDEALSMLEIIKEERGIENTTDLIRYAIFETAKNLRPAYIKQSRDKSDIKPEDRVKAKIEKVKENKNLERLVLIEEKMAIANQLHDVKIEEVSPGEYQIEWPIFEKAGINVLVGRMGKPLEDIWPRHVEEQFKRGTKEEILELLKSNTKNKKIKR